MYIIDFIMGQMNDKDYPVALYIRTKRDAEALKKNLERNGYEAFISEE